ncbi:MAG: rod shape-determining protein MreD [Pseudomonadota bacterium]
MADRRVAERFTGAFLFGALCAVLIFGRLLPLAQDPGRLPGPDLMLAMVFCWMVRRPDQLSPLLIGVVFFIADLLLMRPPGLMAGFVVLATEFLRSRRAALADIPFVAEWGIVSLTIFVVLLAQQTATVIFALTPPSLGSVLFSGLMTSLTYPLITGVLRIGFGLRRAGPAEGPDYGGWG